MKWNTARVLTEGQWVDRPFEQIKVGDRFQLFSDGKLIAEAICERAPVPDEPPEGNYKLVANKIDMLRRGARCTCGARCEFEGPDCEGYVKPLIPNDQSKTWVHVCQTHFPKVQHRLAYPNDHCNWDQPGPT